MKKWYKPHKDNLHRSNIYILCYLRFQQYLRDLHMILLERSYHMNLLQNGQNWQREFDHVLLLKRDHDHRKMHRKYRGLHMNLLDLQWLIHDQNQLNIHLVQLRSCHILFRELHWNYLQNWHHVHRQNYFLNRLQSCLQKNLRMILLLQPQPRNRYQLQLVGEPRKQINKLVTRIGRFHFYKKIHTSMILLSMYHKYVLGVHKNYYKLW